MAELSVTVLLLIVAVIHLIPFSGFTGIARLESLYGIRIEGHDLEVLMRHRAVMFGILGVFLGYAAFVPALQPLAFLAAFVSLVLFFYLAIAVGGYGGAVKRIVVGDVVAAICLSGAALIYYV